MTVTRAALVAAGALTLAGFGGHEVLTRPEGAAPAPVVAGTSVARGAAAPTSAVPGTTSSTSTPPAASTPPTTASPPPPPPTAEEERGRAALGLLSFGLDDLAIYSPGWTVAFLPAKAGYRGLTMPAERRTEIYVRLGDTVGRLSQTVAHELGHVIDVTTSTDATRRAYLEIRGIAPGQTWFGCDGCTDFATPAGDFAETVGLALTGSGYRWKSTLGPPPTAEQLAAVRALYRW